MRVGSSQVAHLLPSMARTTRAIEKALARLSSGSRLASPREDIAATSMATTLDAQTRGIGVGLRNINAAQSLLMTADSALSSQIEIAQRLRELAVQASQSTLNSSDRQSLRTEAMSLLEEYRRLTRATTFNDQQIIDGSVESLQVAFEGSNFSVDLADSSSQEIFTIEGGNGTFTFAQSFGTSSDFANEVELGDIDNDGDQDVLMTFSTGTGLVIRLNNGEGVFSQAATLGVGASFYRPEFGDINNDGILDIAVGSSTGTMWAYLGNGDGTYEAPITTAFDAQTYETVLGDFNEDGNLDLIATMNSRDTVAIALGNGDGTFQAETTYTVGGSPRGVAVGDLNSDGHMDLAIAGSGANSVSLLMGDGNGSFTVGTTLTGGLTPQMILITDLNQDGINDIALSTYNNGYLSLFLGTATGSFTAGTTVTLANGLFGLRQADFNNDGAPDLVALNSLNGDASILINNGAGTFTQASTISTVGLPIALAAGDVNGDGHAELLFGGWSTSALSVYQPNLATRSAEAEINFDTAVKASHSLEIIDRALDALVSARSQLAASHSRLDAAASQQLLLSESLASARSNLMDVDIAEETAELVRLQILQQAQVAVAAQSNLQLQTVLGLLNSLN